MGRDVGVIIPAAGQGQRLGSDRSKALLTVAGAPMILHSLRLFARHPAVGPIVVAIREEDRAALQRLLREHRLTGQVQLAAGGASRAASVANALRALPSDIAWVLVHDAARPCLGKELLSRVIEEVRQHEAVAAGLPAALTVKTVDRDQMIRLTLDRESLWLAQTPQAFRRDWLEEAFARAADRLEQMPDDAAVCEWAGYPVRMVHGDPLNVKVTVAEDLALASAVLSLRKPDGVFAVRSSKFEGSGNGQRRTRPRSSKLEARTVS